MLYSWEGNGRCCSGLIGLFTHKLSGLEEGIENPVYALVGACHPIPCLIGVGFCAVVVDVSAWLKSLRLHKYSPLFQQITYSEMMSLTDDWLESRVSRL